MHKIKKICFLFLHNFNNEYSLSFENYVSVIYLTYTQHKGTYLMKPMYQKKNVR